jgi:hypothetical protein
MGERYAWAGGAARAARPERARLRDGPLECETRRQEALFDAARITALMGARPRMIPGRL